MSRIERRYHLLGIAQGFLSSPRFTATVSTLAIGTAFSTHLVRSTMGWPGLIGAVCALVVLAAASFIAQLRFIEWNGLLPISLISFVAWCGLSIFWTVHQWVSLAGVLYQISFAFLGVFIALVRDTIQVVRAVGDVLRVLLTLSLALEVLSGILIDMPIDFLGIHGDIAAGGPIQGIFGTRNQLSIVALIAFVTFLVEWRTRSVRRTTALPSIALAVVCLLFTHSPVIAAVLVLVALATLALFGLRALPAHARSLAQWALSAAVVIVLVLAYVFRSRVIDLLNARQDFFVRYDLWLQIWHLDPGGHLLGWGWTGWWQSDIPPYDTIDFLLGQAHDNALNAYLDVVLQVGVVGLLLFAAMLALAFSRAWLVAANKRTVVHVWVPLVLVALLATSVFESSILVEAGWMLLVVCCVKASQSLSWRSRMPAL